MLRGPQIESPHIFNIRTQVLLIPSALFGSMLLIIRRISSFGNSEGKTPPFEIREHWLEKKELKSHFLPQ